MHDRDSCIFQIYIPDGQKFRPTFLSLQGLAVYKYRVKIKLVPCNANPDLSSLHFLSFSWNPCSLANEGSIVYQLLNTPLLNFTNQLREIVVSSSATFIINLFTTTEASFTRYQMNFWPVVNGHGLIFTVVRVFIICTCAERSLTKSKMAPPSWATKHPCNRAFTVQGFGEVIAWSVVIFGINTTIDISKLL